ncbi:di-heme oxidoredictase family protein [uncultured Tateyamaria sp.]|uniref:di-heme oxidoredictase family protein n=1 Tax=uncultured Tateyamaria sp. TaxID=455651 RepID=UPI00344B4F89
MIDLLGGKTASLRTQDYAVTHLGYGPLHPDAMLSARVAPQMIGLGLLDAIPVADVLALAEPDDAGGDGISGRPQIVMSAEYGVPMLGRFGLQAGKPSVWEQSAGAFAGDNGILTSLHPAGCGDCTLAQVACRAASNGNTADHDGVELADLGLQLVSFYSSILGVPARRDIDDPDVLLGKQVFYETGCISCHTPKHVTHCLVGQPEKSFQLIWPYLDMPPPDRAALIRILESL